MEIIKLEIVDDYNEFISRFEKWCDKKIVSYYIDDTPFCVVEYENKKIKLRVNFEGVDNEIKDNVSDFEN